MKKIAIIGGGVIGTSCAVQIAEWLATRQHHSIDVCIIAEEFSPGTTGCNSAGLWGPFLLDQTPHEQIIKWSKVSHDFFHELWKDGNAAVAGVALIPTVRLTCDDIPFNYYWRNVVFGYEDLSQKQLDIFGRAHHRNYKKGARFVTFTCQPKYLLPYLYQRFRRAGGQLIQRKVKSLDEFKDYDLVINCVGLGARDLVNDIEVAPIRGQVVRIQADWMFTTYLDDSDDGNYIIPNIGCVVLGGTHQKYDYNKKSCPYDAKFIHAGCVAKVAALKNCQVLEEWVGLRPGRKTVRLERDQLVTANGKVLKIIHNYGHGGAGVTLAWGCAKNVLSIVEQMWNEKGDTSTNPARMGELRDIREYSQQDDGKMKLKCKL